MYEDHIRMDSNPIKQFLLWYEEAVEAEIKNPDAMTLATATRNGVPSARVVLYKGLNKNGIRFFTNFQSRKGRELKSNPKAALVFYWSLLDRQIRIEGKIEKLSSSESDQYWHSRPRESCLSALASSQSATLPDLDRDYLEKKLQKLDQEFAAQTKIPRPPYWGGYRLIPKRFEFWIAGEFRFHDRFCYIKNKNKWRLSRLAP